MIKEQVATKIVWKQDVTTQGLSFTRILVQESTYIL